MLNNITPIPSELVFPVSAPWLPNESPGGKFVVTPEQLSLQLLIGVHNPFYHQASGPEEAIEYLTAWRSAVVACESNREVGDPDYPGFHVTNSLAKIALHPLRQGEFSLKQVYRAEELRFERQQRGRDPEELSALWHSLRSLLVKVA